MLLHPASVTARTWGNPARSSASRQRAAGAGADPWGLSLAQAVLSAHLNEALQQYGSAALDAVDLPPLSSSAALAPGQIRVAAALFWARWVEQAGIPGFVEALCERLMQGRLQLPLRDVTAQLVRFFRKRDERFGPEERRAIYDRVFGADSNSAFFLSWGRLLAELDGVGRSVGQATPSQLARLNVAARELGGLLSGVGGMSAFAARDIVATIRSALAILEHQEIVASLGPGGVWNIVARHGPRFLDRPVSPSRSVALAVAGQTVLTWLADNAPQIAEGRVVVAADSAVVSAAQRYLLESRET